MNLRLLLSSSRVVNRNRRRNRRRKRKRKLAKVKVCRRIIMVMLRRKIVGSV